MQQDVKYMVTFALATLERNWETDSANTGMMPKTDQLTIYSQHTYINTSTNLTRILKSYMKREFLSKAWKRITGRQIHLFIGYKSAYGTQYRIETLLLLALWSLRWPYCVKNETFTYSKDFIQGTLYNIFAYSPSKEIFSGHIIFMRFLNISSLGDWIKFSYFMQCLRLWRICRKHCIVVM